MTAAAQAEKSPMFIAAHQSGEPCRPAPTARVRARRTDPATSQSAAANAERFAASHAGRILAALEQLGSATAHEIAHATGLTVVQVDRRLPECERAGSARVLTMAGNPLIRDGFRVWART